jgi:4-alpha-glucanotransferase
MLRFVLALHNHQPVGNFDYVIDQAYRDSYQPFLDVIEEYPEIPFALHTSGCLMEWLAAKKPQYIERLRKLVQDGRVEIIGGAFHEPILPMIPRRDRIGQIKAYAEYLHELIGTTPTGLWLAERVWEQSLASDLAEAGVEYTILDDFHFRKAGLKAEELTEPFLTEDEGRVITVFPGSEPARYLIPFQEPQRFIDYLKEVEAKTPNAVVVFADDGEKFGTWPETHAHVYTHGWLRRFFDAIRENKDWLQVCTPSQVLEATPPTKTIYLPDCSYREMTEWALSSDVHVEYQHLWHELDQFPGGDRHKAFMKGGYWRNFKVRYPETQEMYARMMEVSRQQAEADGQDVGDRWSSELLRSRESLYRGQCNCPYWHGAFGGVYLPHLRNGVYAELIKADSTLAGRRHHASPFLETDERDFNFDGRNEIKIANDEFAAYFAPASGGCLYELDVRAVKVNLGSTLARRPEAYHEKIRKHTGEHAGVGSIHDRVVFKQEGLEKKLFYDRRLRKSFQDHVWKEGVSLDAIDAGIAHEIGIFADRPYRSTLKHHRDSAKLILAADAEVDVGRLSVRKMISAAAGSSFITGHYEVNWTDGKSPMQFGVEFNFAALASTEDDRYYLVDGEKRGRLSTKAELPNAKDIHLVDEWLGIDVGLSLDRPADWFVLPVQTVSGSEAGFELVHQSACVIPTWMLPARGGRLEFTLMMSLDCSRAKARKA